MKIFLSYRFTGENHEVLRQNITQISENLRFAGHKVWNSFDYEPHYKENNFDNRQIMQHAFENLDQAEVFFAFINSPEKSEGMLLEAGYAFARGKKLILAIRKDLETISLKLMASKVIQFLDLADLSQQLRELKDQDLKDLPNLKETD